MKTLSLILLSTFFAYLLAQDCNNPLLAVFGLTGLDSPQDGSGLAFCENLQNGQSCCSVNTVQGFQSRLDRLANSLESLAATRDVYMTELYANYSSRFQRAADDLTDYSDEVDRLERDNATLGGEVRSQYNSLNRIANALDDIDDQFRSSMREYQQRRSDCFETVLQIQASAWCLACDPDYASSGVQSDGSVNSSPAVCNAIQSSCAPFVSQADYLNPIFQARQAYRRLINLTTYLRNYENSGFVIDEDAVIDNDIYVPQRNSRKTSALPQGCTQNSCEWQCENFFSSSFVLNNSIVSNGGGILGGDDIDFPPIPNNQGRLLRNLQESLWAPNLQETGLTYTVVDDPANVAAIWSNNAVYDDSDTNNPTDNANTNTDNDDGLTDNDGVDTTGRDNNLTDNDGINTTGNANDFTDNDGIDTTGNNNDFTDNDGIDTTGNNNNNNNNNDFTDGDGIDTTGDDTNNDNTNDDNTQLTNPTNPTNPTGRALWAEEDETDD